MIEIKRIDMERAMSRAVTEYMTELAPSLPPMWWTLDLTYGRIKLDGLAVEGGVRAVQAWAAELGLTQVDEPVNAGTVVYFGHAVAKRIDVVEVWCITDRAAFDRDTDELIARGRALRAAREAASADGAGR